MLSVEHRDLVKATVPLLESGGEALTKHFYGILLREHPEVRALFNQAHQASGDQARALANGVLMYARHIDRLEALGPLVGQIINKHVSLQVLPEHYPIVGGCLLRAIREVLGAEVATDAVIDAWAAAYGQLADILIAAEEGIYAANAAVPGGWRGGREFRVVRKVPESEEITSFHLEPADGGAVPAFRPGQYLGLSLLVGGEGVRRNYSISAPGNGRELRISVKREPGGRVSGHLHAQVQAGDSLTVFPPAGDFVLREGRRPLAFITAGVGITPALPMLDEALRSGREVRFIHFARHGGVHAFRDHLDGLAAAHAQLRRFYCYSEPRDGDVADATGFVSQDLLADWLPENRDLDAYFLGPRPFMRAVQGHLHALGVPAQQCHHEFFGPAEALEA